MSIQEIAGQTGVVIGGSLVIGLETARRARDQGAKLILTGRNSKRLSRAARELGALSTADFDATNFEQLAEFFDKLPKPIDHILVTGPGPYYAPLAEFDFEKARHDVEAHLFLPLHVARNAVGKVRAGGTLLFMGGTGGRRVASGYALISSLTAALPALTKNLALELAPIRVNLIAAGSWTRLFRHRCLVISWMRVASSSAQNYRSNASWVPVTLRRLRFTS